MWNSASLLAFETQCRFSWTQGHCGNVTWYYSLYHNTIQSSKVTTPVDEKKKTHHFSLKELHLVSHGPGGTKHERVPNRIPISWVLEAILPKLRWKTITMYFTKSTLSLVGSQLSVGHLLLMSLKLNPVLFALKTMKIWGLKQLSRDQNAESPLRKKLYGSVWHIAAPFLCEEPILTPNCQLEPVPPSPNCPLPTPALLKEEPKWG